MTEPTAYEMRAYCNQAAAVADRLHHQAALIQNSSGDSKAEARAGKLKDDANAIRALLRFHDRHRPKLPPELESLEGALGAVTGQSG